MRTLEPNFVVGVGGSAGGLYAYIALLDALPANTGMAFVIVSHMLPTAQNLLANILVYHTKMPVRIAAQAMPIRANHVYVNPPNTDLRMEGQVFTLVSPRTRSNKQVDFFLMSLAEHMGTQAIGIVLSGYDGDGTQGCRQIKANGGKTFAQDASANVGDMPQSAQDAGCIDFVLSPEKISEHLQLLSAARPVGR